MFLRELQFLLRQVLPMRIPTRSVCAIVCATWLVGLGAGASQTSGSDNLEPAAVDYLRDVKPLLQKRCYSCHGALKQSGDLRLDTGLLVRKGGASGPAVEPGNVAESLLIERVQSADPGLRMPPEGAALTQAEVAILAAWISQGAPAPDNEAAQQNPRDHWAFQRPVRPAVPQVRPDWVLNPIDAFISARHVANRVDPLPEADRATLLRRVTLDLTGVPPTREELQRFLADTSAMAYENAVDRLLDSPRYGERWGRHWMDVWRYSDWYGRRAVPDVMNSYPQVWRWRDWIVVSLNRDAGYDQMLADMLAADELAPGDDDRVVATGFLVRNWFKWNYENWMKDNVEHTAKAFLGLTLNCAHCHDHKYDPLTQEEYFRFRAFFEPLELRQDRVPGLPDPGPFKKYVYAQSYGPIAAGRIRVFDEKLDAQTFIYSKGDSRNRIEGKPPQAPGVPAVLGNAGFVVEPVELPAEAYYPGLKEDLRAEERARVTSELHNARETLARSEDLLAAARLQAERLREQTSPPADSGQPGATGWLQAEQTHLDARLTHRVDTQHVIQADAAVRALEARIAADDARYRGIGAAAALAQRAFQAEKQLAWEETQLRIARAERGLILAERQAVSDANAKPQVEKARQELAAARGAADGAIAALAASGESYTPLSPVYPSRSTGRRRALARWIASPANPLTARVAVNHMWMRHFGRGLVETPNNFGRNGKPPSHPELLDWLAVELMENGWHMKRLHRLMVTSRTYRLRSGQGAVDHVNLAVDRDNRTYWKANPRRMEAEMVRDSVLACAEELDPTVGGPELDLALGATSRRRSLYFAIHGEARMPFLELFDAADVCDCYERGSSVRPQQALALANSELPLLASRLLAQKLARQVELSGSEELLRDRAFVELAFEQILSRRPTGQEVLVSLEFLAEQRRDLSSLAEADRAAPAAPGVPAAAVEIAQRARESLVHALFNHNDFVTVR